MVGLILATHGTMAAAALDVASMFLGEQEKVSCISFLAGDSLETLIDRFQTAITELGTVDGVLILTDLKGGSPCNVATLYQKTTSNVQALYGFNVPMLLELLDAREQTSALDKLVQAALDAGAREMGSIVID